MQIRNYGNANPQRVAQRANKFICRIKRTHYIIADITLSMWTVLKYAQAGPAAAGN
jgi:hypothetical protein